jgi:hypothetical protein
MDPTTLENVLWAILTGVVGLGVIVIMIRLMRMKR